MSEGCNKNNSGKQRSSVNDKGTVGMLMRDKKTEFDILVWSLLSFNFSFYGSGDSCAFGCIVLGNPDLFGIQDGRLDLYVQICT